MGLSLSNPTGGATLGSMNTAVLIITDNDPAPTDTNNYIAQPGQLQFSASTYTAAENCGSATVTVTRTGGSDGVVTVAYATGGGTATAGSDYSAATGTLTFDNGVADLTFSIPVTDDTAFEGSETVDLSLSNPTGGATLGGTNTAVLIITDDENPEDNEAVPEYPRPQLIDTLASPTGTGVPVSGAIKATFDLDIYDVGNIAIRLEYGAIVNTIYGSITNNQLTAPYSSLAYDTTYTVTIPAEIAQSVIYGTINAPISWNFTTCNPPDTNPPQLVNSIANGGEIFLTYDKPLDEKSVPFPKDFAVKVNSSEISVISIVVTGKTVTLALASKVTCGDTVILSYTKEQNAIRDLYGNNAANLTNRVVLNPAKPQAINMSPYGSGVISVFIPAGAVKDVADHALVKDYGFTFTTEDQ
ncbi:MAG: Calx-beta domain protein [Pelotomaculum sp. PtaU1.Bin035]|nr:MAG: Calx-beta domain protein [Pelotomaculum sp. PtaU1.Bin035]